MSLKTQLKQCEIIIILNKKIFINYIVTMAYPAEWSDNMGNLGGSFNKNILSYNTNEIEKGLTRDVIDPIITIPSIKPLKSRTLTKDFKNEIDDNFKTRSSQLPDSNFKEMTTLIKVKRTDIRGHYIPGFTETKNNLSDMPRKFEEISKKNEFGFDKTAIKGLNFKKVNPEDVAPVANQKNKFNIVGFDAARESGGNTPIVTIPHTRKVISIIK